MQFKEIIGQVSVKKRLRQLVAEGRIPHAMLLSGPQGVGKLQLAVAYAQYLNCQHRTSEDSCGVCPTCLQFQKLQHPDLHFAFPIVKRESDSSAVTCDEFMDVFRQTLLTQRYFGLDDWYRALGVETKQGMIYERESGEIIRKLALKSFGEGYKVMIIWCPEKMNTECANKLLKLIEEPPVKTVFLLVSDHPEQLLSTIYSRTQQLLVPRLTEEDLTAHFSADIAHIAMGSYLTASRIASENEQNKIFLEDFKALMRNAWRVAYKKDYVALQELRKWSLDIADSKVGRERQKAFLQYAQGQVRENYIRNFSAPDMNYQTEDEAAFSKNFAPFINAGNVEQIMQQLDLAEQQITQNGNAKIIFFDLCLQMIVLIKQGIGK